MTSAGAPDRDHKLRHELENLYRGNDGHSSMFITVLSFGFKYRIPADADLVFDVRFLPNPYYVEELRFHTGTEKAVQDYVMQGGTGEEFLKKLNDLLEFVIPKYEQEGKTQLVISYRPDSVRRLNTSPAIVTER